MGFRVVPYLFLGELAGALVLAVAQQFNYTTLIRGKTGERECVSTITQITG